MIREFREFVNRGNLVDIAVAFVLGTAFATMTAAFTERILSPLLAMVVDVSGLERLWTFGPTDPETGLPRGSLGAFLQAALNFLIVGLVMFGVVKAYNGMRRRFEEPDTPAEPPAEPEDIRLLREIRDALASPSR